jgi:hypothetical protein
MQSEDTNHDGRPDVWRYYDSRGVLARVSIDSNFDGRPDREEQYRNGSLTRRETDRNFDQRVDLIEEFDPSTHEHLKSVVDADFDGRADLLVLFQDGRPVHSEWAAPLAQVPAPSAGPRAPSADGLLALADPFASAAALAVPRSTESLDEIAVAVDGLVVHPVNLVGDASPRPDRVSSVSFAPRADAFLPASPRAPPVRPL